MAARTYYAVLQNGKPVQHKLSNGMKMPMLFLGKRNAELTAHARRHELKKKTTVKAVKIS